MAFVISGTDASGAAIHEAYERRSAAETWLRTYLGAPIVVAAERNTIVDTHDGRRLTVSYEALTPAEIRTIQGV